MAVSCYSAYMVAVCFNRQLSGLPAENWSDDRCLDNAKRGTPSDLLEWRR